MRAPRLDDGQQVEEVQKRESEIFQSLVEERERLQREAEIMEDRQNPDWEEQERKAREAENAKRELAQKAREKHQQMIRTSESILPALKDHKAGSLREAMYVFIHPYNFYIKKLQQKFATSTKAKVPCSYH